MSLALWRFVLDPLSSWRALRLRREAGGHLSFDAAWRQARMLAAPDEMVYRLHGHQHYHSRMMSLLLADVCRRDSTGPEPMLSALVVNGSSRKPSDQLFELAVTEFHRRDPDWTWERDAVFDRYRSPVST